MIQDNSESNRGSKSVAYVPTTMEFESENLSSKSRVRFSFTVLTNGAPSPVYLKSVSNNFKEMVDAFFIDFADDND